MQLILVILLVLFTGYGLLMLYYWYSWKNIPTPASVNDYPSTKIAVIIPSRNEAANLPALLASIQQQTYPASMFELIVIDDHSTDDTFKIASNFPSSNIRCIKLAEHLTDEINSYKKKAIEIAISQSQAELIITTDADCVVPANWLKHIESFYRLHKAKMIIMPVMYFPEYSALDIFQSLDFMVLQGITGAAVHQKLHAMCNGANLAYTREAFYAAGGFKGIDHIASGDDMLLLQKMSRLFPNDIFYLKDHGVLVQTAATPDVKSFINQRIRWASKAGNYKGIKIISIMLLVYLVNICMLFFPILFFYSQNVISLINLWLWYGLLAFIKISTELIFLFPVAQFFNKSYLLKWFILAQPFHVLYTVISGGAGMLGKYEWKGRKL